MSALPFPTDAEPSPVADYGEAHKSFYVDVVDGLARVQKQLPPKYFYDEEGSRLFDAICELQEYYPYRAELQILDEVATDLEREFKIPCSLVEFGAGSLKKVEPLLNNLSGIQRFIPIDISGSHLRSACNALQQRYPSLSVCPVVADFSKVVQIGSDTCERLGFFPGSTLGNFSPDEARQFLLNAKHSLGESSRMIIGVDTKKSPNLIHQAYNDEAGITAQFNRNLLERINRELDGDFDSERFAHYACYNPFLGRVEMHLISLREQRVQIAGETFLFRQGESIHTENSYKYTGAEFSQLANKSGWQIDREWLADEGLFAVYLLRSIS